MWQIFLDHWNGASLFLPPFTEPSSQIHLLRKLPVPLAMGTLPISSTLPLA